MSSSNPAHPTLPASEVRTNRIKLVLLLGCFAAPLIVGTLLYFFWQPSTTGNYGELLRPPPNIHQATLARLDPAAAPMRLQEMHGKWFLLASADRACGAEVCLERIEMTRKIKTLLGKHQNRLHRVFVFHAPTVGFQPPDQDQLTLLVHTAEDRTGLRELLREGHFYIVDPFGHVILRYAPNAQQGLVLKDLNRLMKYSPIG